MLRIIARKTLVILLSLLIANFIGYSFAFVISPLASAGNPYAQAQDTRLPVLPYYFEYFQGLLHGEFGQTHNGEPVLAVIARVGQASLGLMGIALLLSILLGVSLGRLAVRREKPGIAAWLTVLSTVGLASPGFFIAVLFISLILLIYFAGTAGAPIIPFIGFGWDAHLVLPVLALAVQPMVKIARMTGGLLSEEMGKQYVLAERGFGIPFGRIKRKFAFRSILSGVILTVAASTRLMIAEMIIIERLFNWPGFGRLLSLTLSLKTPSQDYLSPPMVAILLTVLVAAFLLVDLLASVLTRWLDPRLRAEAEAEMPARGAI